ncbi:MAG TPA: ATP-binding cassette domain-containing protein [Thermotogota bacterium]|nr:ATP-binding cassette domain-containing protein [Thermotogota bacterium]HRW92612.1 ATP-binding cassette domain-containing protein [Thermotogota bacterium]
MVELEGITVVYNPGQDNQKVALEDVSLGVNNGDFLVVVGANGAGKSTLLKVLLGEVEPLQGHFKVNGKVQTDRSPSRRAKTIGRVYQDPNSGVFPNLTIRENLSVASRKGMRGLGFSGIPQKVLEHLESLDLGLEKRMETKAGELSGGQKQALAMVMAIASDPELLLLDEHTASLDPKSAKKVMDLTKRINEKLGITIMMITHNMEFAGTYGNRQIRVEEGKIFEMDSPVPEAVCGKI